MKQRLLPLILGIILLLSGTAKAHASAEEGIAAVVNDSVITVTDVNERTKLYLSGSSQQSSPEDRKKMEQQVLGKLIDEALQLQEAKKLDITIDEGQVNNGFSYIAKQNNLSPDEFRKRLKDSGVSIDSLFAQIKAEIAWDQVIKRKLRPQVSITESDIDMTMDQIAQGKGKKQYHVAEILLNVPNAAEDSDVHSKADDLVKQIRDGAPFSGIARANSQAPGANSGGDLGWVQEGQLAPELDAVLKKLQPGQIAPPILSGNNYHILFLRETRNSGDDSVTSSAATPQGPVVLLKQILIPVTQKDTNNIIKAKMERGITLKKEIKNCDDMDKKMKDFPAKGTGTLGHGLQSSLQQPLLGIVEKLAVNELSQPIQAPGGWALIMVCSRENAPAPQDATSTSTAAPQQATSATPQPAAGETTANGSAPTPANLSLDKSDEKARENVADKLGAQRLDKMAERYLTDLRAAAFIDKRI